MQLPGMSTDPVRLSLDVTWDPADGSFSFSRRLWTRPVRGDRWELEDMATSASPVFWEGLEDRWRTASNVALEYFRVLVEAQTPFP